MMLLHRQLQIVHHLKCDNVHVASVIDNKVSNMITALIASVEDIGSQPILFNFRCRQYPPYH